MNSEVIDRLLLAPFSSIDFKSTLKIATNNEIKLVLVRLKKKAKSKLKLEACKRELEKR